MFNEILEGGLNQAITRRLGMKGAAPLPAVAPELFVGMTLENDRPEWGFLKQELLYGYVVTVAAAPGAYSTVALQMPLVASNMIAVIESVQARTQTAFLGFRAAYEAPGVQVNGGSRDQRNTQTSRVQVTPGSISALPSRLIDQIGANTTERNPVILSPSTDYLHIVGGTINTALTVAVTWRERTAQPGELV